MRVVIQRVKESSVTIDGIIKGAIGEGMMVLVGFENDDTIEDIQWMTGKISRLRIFPDDDGVMNRSVKEIGGEVLIISQFTLFASTKKGNRPSYIYAASPEVAIPLYETFLEEMQKEIDKPVQKGVFGADMKVSLINDGPVTIIIDTKKKE